MSESLVLSGHDQPQIFCDSTGRSDTAMLALSTAPPTPSRFFSNPMLLAKEEGESTVTV